MENIIYDLENNMKNLSPEMLEKDLKKLNDELNAKLLELRSQQEEFKYKTLVPIENLCTFCNLCENNCHDPCDCRFSTFTRCIKYSFWSKICEVCGCEKTGHKQDYYHFIYKTKTVPKNTDKEQEQEKEKNEEKKKIINEEIKKKR